MCSLCAQPGRGRGWHVKCIIGKFGVDLCAGEPGSTLINRWRKMVCVAYILFRAIVGMADDNRRDSFDQMDAGFFSG